MAAVEESWQNCWAKWESIPLRTDLPCGRSRFVMSLPIAPGKSLSATELRGVIFADALSRFYRQQGLAVLHPLIWNAFDPSVSEGADSKGMTPQDFLALCQKNHGEMLRKLGCWYQEDQQVITNDPAYLLKTQRLFLALVEGGLIYRHGTSQWFLRVNPAGLMDDWCISRLHATLPAWGTPIPFLFGQFQGWMPVQQRDLPVGLGYPYPKQLQSMHGKETATAPTESLDSSFDLAVSAVNACIGLQSSLTTIDSFLPVDVLIADKASSVQYLAQTRFLQQALGNLGFSKVTDPFRQVLCPGTVCRSEDLDAILRRLGADVLRLALLVSVPLQEDLRLGELLTYHQDLNYLWTLVRKKPGPETSTSVSREALIKQMTLAYETGDFTRAWPLWRQTLYKDSSLPTQKILVRLLFPLAPHLASHLWQELTGSDRIEDAGWPQDAERIS
jgi:leucyl-tRNA synthetase